MGTRGAYGFRVGKKDKVTYNHFDSYPTGLGVKILEFVKETPVEKLKEIAENVCLVDEDAKPTPEEIAICHKAGTVDLGVGSGSQDDWYCLLRGAQGNMELLADCPLLIDSKEFLHDSLFCEYAYIINVDTGKVEIYRGFNKRRNGMGRYAKKLLKDNREEKYYGVALFTEISFEDVKKIDSLEEYLDGVSQRMDKDYEEQEKELRTFNPKVVEGSYR